MSADISWCSHSNAQERRKYGIWCYECESYIVAYHNP